MRTVAMRSVFHRTVIPNGELKFYRFANANATGGREPSEENIDRFRQTCGALKKAGIKYVAYPAPRAAHEFHT
jgi:hypothetical protein